jgi:hypothetical protein
MYDEFFFHLNYKLNLKIKFSKLKYNLETMCINIQVDSNIFNTCNYSFFYVIKIFIYNKNNQP